MAVHSYIVLRDFGFAPNPFYGICSLATCKPRIRKKAKVGDWIIGFGSAAKGSPFKHKIIYIMQISKKITFDEYWNLPEYQNKKPVLNGSLKQNYGDNIYHKVNGNWVQDNSHHSLKDGEINMNNLERDTSSEYVLLGERFWYYGKDAIETPTELAMFIPNGRGERIFRDEDGLVETFVATQDESGLIGDPYFFKGEFKRYNGK